MSHKLVIDSEEGHREIDYSVLSLREINRRIREYKKKYKGSYLPYCSCLSYSDASSDEMTEIMDWDGLVEEKAERIKTAKKDGLQ